MHYKYITLHYTINFNAKVTIHIIKIKKIRTHVTRVQSPKARAYFLLNLSILLVLTHYVSVSYLLLTLDEKAVMIGRVRFPLQSHKYSLVIIIK